MGSGLNLWHRKLAFDSERLILKCLGSRVSQPFIMELDMDDWFRLKDVNRIIWLIIEFNGFEGFEWKFQTIGYDFWKFILNLNQNIHNLSIPSNQSLAKILLLHPKLTRRAKLWDFQIKHVSISEFMECVLYENNSQPANRTSSEPGNVNARES